MASVDLQSVISLPPALVYDALADLSHRPALDATISEIAVTASAVEPGTTFSGRGTVTGSDSGFDGIVTAAERPVIFGYGLTTANGARLVEEYRLSAVPSGTLLGYHAELHLPGGLFGRLLDRVMVGSGFHKQRLSVLARMKSILEGGSGGQH